MSMNELPASPPQHEGEDYFLGSVPESYLKVIPDSEEEAEHIPGFNREDILSELNRLRDMPEARVAEIFLMLNGLGIAVTSETAPSRFIGAILLTVGALSLSFHISDGPHTPKNDNE